MRIFICTYTYDGFSESFASGQCACALGCINESLNRSIDKQIDVYVYIYRHMCVHVLFVQMSKPTYK